MCLTGMPLSVWGQALSVYSLTSHPVHSASCSHVKKEAPRFQFLPSPLLLATVPPHQWPELFGTESQNRLTLPSLSHLILIYLQLTDSLKERTPSSLYNNLSCSLHQTLFTVYFLWCDHGHSLSFGYHLHKHSFPKSSFSP